MIDEASLGLERFYTEGLPGIGGRLKKSPDDFVVDEISIRPQEVLSGNYVIARVCHRNWEANRLFRRLGSNLRIGRASVGFAGTKDGRSVATQLMSFRAPIEAVTSLRIPDVKILEAYTSSRAIAIGDLIGNRFAVAVRDLEEERDARRICHEIHEKLNETIGFPNFFGVQRFGSIRPITHLVGRDLSRSDAESAVMRYIGNPMHNGSEGDEARDHLQQTRDFEKAMAEFPTKFTFERIIISHLAENPGDYIGALRRLPRNLVMMFVHAYQSFMFNRILSERLRRGLSIHEPVLGDLVLPLSKDGVPNHGDPIEVTEENIVKATRNAAEGKAFVSGALFGSESVLASGEMGEIERRVIQDEGVSAKDFQIVGLREASSKGTRRELLAPVKDFDTIFENDAVTFKFALNKGCYATCLLREYMKADASAY
ncbi:MAG: tRNA pseudouridine(13) synthase TruD [Methanobacteriota archaeon]|nr:MAG: tRNA pseudouridine(13) synthase TruD [Euryarchaeota archaeon]